MKQLFSANYTDRQTPFSIETAHKINDEGLFKAVSKAEIFHGNSRNRESILANRLIDKTNKQ